MQDVVVDNFIIKHEFRILNSQSYRQSKECFDVDENYFHLSMYLHVSALLWYTHRNKPIILVRAVSFQKGGVGRSPRAIAVGWTIYS